MSERDDCSRSVREVARREFLLRWGRRSAFAAVLAALCYACFFGYTVAREAYLVRQAQRFFHQHEYQSAALVSRRVLQLNDRNIEASRLMAEMAETASRPEAVMWRQRVTNCPGSTVDDRFALSAAALRFGQVELANNVLSSLANHGAKSAKFYELCGAVALAQKQPEAAEKQFAAALQADPSNKRTALNLALVRLAGSVERRAEGREQLQLLTEDPAAKDDALRALTREALASGNRSLAKQWAGQLMAAATPPLSDRLLYLETCDQVDAVMLDKAKAEAKTAATAAELITWMNRHGLANSARDWGLSLSGKIANTQPLPLAIAESYSFTQDWNGLHSWIAAQQWGEFESFRFAVQSHALHRLNSDERNSAEAQSTWRAALRATGNRAEQLTVIAQLAEGWGYKSDAEETWWTIAAGTDSPHAALQALHQFYKTNQDTRGLLRVAKRALELNPTDLVAANNCASFGLLLTGDSTSRRLATKLYSEHPDNVALAATYAFALHTEGKTADALRVLQSLKEEHLRNPAIAAYYFVMLVENGEIERARPLLEAAQKAVLLPEERRLLLAATRKVAQAETAKQTINVAKS